LIDARSYISTVPDSKAAGIRATLNRDSPKPSAIWTRVRASR